MFRFGSRLLKRYSSLTRVITGSGLPPLESFAQLVDAGEIQSPLTLSRVQPSSSVATALAADGTTWTQYAASEPRRHGVAQRLLLEGASINQIVNPRPDGTGTGLPSSWNYQTSLVSGLSQSIIGRGVANGLPYLDYRIFGTAASTGYIRIQAQMNGNPAWTNGQKSAFSLIYSMVDGTTAGFNPTHFGLRLTSFAPSTVDSFQYNPPPTSTPQRAKGIFTATGSGSGATALQPLWEIQAGIPVDITIRFQGWQVEHQQSYHTTPILPATTGFSSRSADIVTSALSGLDISANGTSTILWNGLVGQLIPTSQTIFQIDDGSQNNLFALKIEPGSGEIRVHRALAGAAANTVVGTFSVNSPFKVGISISGGRIAASFNGATAVALTGGPTSSLTTLRLGSNASGTENIFGEIADFGATPIAISDADLATRVAAYPDNVTDVVTPPPDPVEVEYTGVPISLWTGHTEPESAVVAAQLTEPSANVRMVVSTSESLTDPLYSPVAATVSITNNGAVSGVPTTTYIARPTVTGLSPDTQYYYGIQADDTLLTSTDSRGKFKTPPAANTAASFRFAFGSCADLTVTTTIYAAIANLSPQPLFFQGMGDNPYIDLNDTVEANRHTAWDKMLTNSGQKALWKNLPMRSMWDDHDYGLNDAGGDITGKAVTHAAWRKRVPHPPLPLTGNTAPICYRYDVGRVVFLILDLRSERTTSGGSSSPGAATTRMGATAKQWLKDQLATPNEGKVFVIGSSVPWIAHSGSPYTVEVDSWYGFQAERIELADYMKAQGLEGRVAIISGDAHMLAYDSGHNADYATGGGMNIPVMHGGPMHRENSTKGGPYYDLDSASPTTNRVWASGHGFAVVDVTDTGANTISFTYNGHGIVSGTSAVRLGPHSFSLSTVTASAEEPSASTVAIRQGTSNSGGNSGSNNVDLTLSQAAVANNLLLAWVTPDKSFTDFNTPTGFTLVPGTKHTTGANTSCALFYKVAEGGETTVNVGYSGTLRLMSALMVEVEGVDPTNPIDQIAFTNGNAAAARSITVGPVTPTSNGQLAIAFWTIDTADSIRSTSTSDFAFSDGYTLGTNYGVNPLRSVTSNQPANASASKALSTTDATSTTVTYSTGSADEQMMALVTIRPAT